MNAVDVGAWKANWAWSLPLIVLSVVIHVIGLGLINESVVRVLSGAMERRRFMPTFAVVMGLAALLATVLHRIEAACIPANVASIRLLEKTGFRREGFAREYLCIDGVWQDHLLYARLKHDPAP